jgi:hypothetical protein
MLYNCGMNNDQESELVSTHGGWWCNFSRDGGREK